MLTYISQISADDEISIITRKIRIIQTDKKAVIVPKRKRSTATSLLHIIFRFYLKHNRISSTFRRWILLQLFLFFKSCANTSSQSFLNCSTCWSKLYWHWRWSQYACVQNNNTIATPHTIHTIFSLLLLFIHSWSFEFDGKVTEKSVNKGKSNKIIIGEKKQK